MELPVRWWTRELSRQLLASTLMVPALLFIPGAWLVRFLAGWSAYAVVYLVLTWLAYRRRGPIALRKAAAENTPRRRTRLGRALGATPEQNSQIAPSIGMTAALTVMPRADEMDLHPGLVMLICVIAVVACWFQLHTGYALTYLRLYSESGGLEFPGDDEPGIVEFLYFAIGVGTTFGATDVTVTQTRVRRQLLVHGALAFLYNTLIIAVVITIFTTYISR
jgi:uncharacterized membrane protein